MFKLFLILFSIGFAPLVFSKEHIVKKNETLMTISYKYFGTHQCWDLLVAATPVLNGTDIIEIGDKINIPHYSQCTHPNASHNQNEKTSSSKKIDSKEMLRFDKEVQESAKKIKRSFPAVTKADKKKLQDDEFFRKLEQKINKAKGIKKEVTKPAESKKSNRIQLSGSKPGQHNDDHVLNTYLSPKTVDKKLKKMVKKEIRQKVRRKGPRNFTIQLGAFPSVEEAQQLLDNMAKHHLNSIRIERADLHTKGIWYRVRVGHFFDMPDAKKYVKNNNLNAITKEYFILKKEKISKPIFNNNFDQDHAREDRILDELKETNEERFDKLLDED